MTADTRQFLAFVAIAAALSVCIIWASNVMGPV